MRGLFVLLCSCRIHALTGTSPPNDRGTQSNSGTSYQRYIGFATAFVAIVGFALCCFPKSPAKKNLNIIKAKSEERTSKVPKMSREASLRPNLLLLEFNNKTLGVEGKSPYASSLSRQMSSEAYAPSKSSGFTSSARPSLSPSASNNIGDAVRISDAPAVVNVSSPRRASRPKRRQKDLSGSDMGIVAKKSHKAQDKAQDETAIMTSSDMPSEKKAAPTNDDELDNLRCEKLNVASPAGDASLYKKHGLDVGQLLGQGSYGRVYLSKKQKTGKLLAVKEVPIHCSAAEALKKGSGESLKENVENELNLLKVLVHKHVVHYYGHFFSTNQDRLCLVLEYVPGGTVKSQLVQFGSFSDSLVKRYAKQTLHGLSYLHNRSPPVIHRDLKPANLLLSLDGRIKIADFGSAKVRTLITGETARGTLKGSAAYMAPEVFIGKEVGCQQDIWSFGCLVLEMCIAKSPWRDYTINNIMQAFTVIGKSKNLPTPPEGRPDVMVKFMYCCMRRDPRERLSANELLAHEFLADKDKGDFASYSVSAKSHRTRKRDTALKTHGNDSGRRSNNDGTTWSKSTKGRKNRTKNSVHL